jgi:hypothetical protein
MKYGPSKKEYLWRILASVLGFAFMLFAVSYRGLSGMAWIEVFGISVVFFGGTIGWSLWKLITWDKDR